MQFKKQKMNLGLRGKFQSRVTLSFGATVRTHVLIDMLQSSNLFIARPFDSFYWLQRSHLSALSLIFRDMMNDISAPFHF